LAIKPDFKAFSSSGVTASQSKTGQEISFPYQLEGKFSNGTPIPLGTQHHIATRLSAYHFLPIFARWLTTSFIPSLQTFKTSFAFKHLNKKHGGPWLKTCGFLDSTHANPKGQEVEMRVLSCRWTPSPEGIFSPNFFHGKNVKDNRILRIKWG